MTDAADRYGMNVLLRPGQLAALDRCAGAGIRWVRLNLDWSAIEPRRGEFHWDLAANFIDRAAAAGILVYASISYTPPWANGGADRQAPPARTGDWAEFVGITVSRFAQTVKHWGFWNEPNSELFYSGTMSAYLDGILGAGTEAAKKADPSCKVCGPELAHDGHRRWLEWLNAVIPALGGNLDIITHHLYKDRVNGQGGLFDFLDGARWPWLAPSLRDALRGLGAGDKEVWLTEVGWDSNEIGEEAQASGYRETLDGLRGREWIRRTFFYEMMEDPSAPAKYGIVRPDGSAKPAYDVCRFFAGR